MPMSSINITFGTPNGLNLQWFNSFDRLADGELDQLALLCCNAISALHVEILDRREPWDDQTIEKYYIELLESAIRINKDGLTSQHNSHLVEPYTLLKDPPPNTKESNDIKTFRRYLWSISKVAGWSYALLVLCTMGKHKMQKLDEHQRVKLLKRIVQHRDVLFCPSLEQVAFCHNLQQIHLRMDPPLRTGSKKRKRELTNPKKPTTDASGKDTKRFSESEHFLSGNGTSSVPYVLNDDASFMPDQRISTTDAVEFTWHDTKDGDPISLPQAAELFQGVFKNPDPYTTWHTPILTPFNEIISSNVGEVNQGVEPQARAVLSTNQHWPYSVYKNEQPGASSIINPSDTVQPSTFVPKPIKQTCAVLPAAQNHLTSSATSVYQNLAISRHLNANTFNDLVSQAAPPEQVSTMNIAPAYHVSSADPASQDLNTLLPFYM